MELRAVGPVGMTGLMASGPDKVESCQYCQMVRAR
jgi:hypothetical protein